MKIQFPLPLLVCVPCVCVCAVINTSHEFMSFRYSCLEINKYKLKMGENMMVLDISLTELLKWFSFI